MKPQTIIAALVIGFIIYARHKVQSSKKEKRASRKLLLLHNLYEPVPLLTNHEMVNYHEMLKFAANNELTIHVKVRLADLINPRKDLTRREWYSKFMRVTSKHVDFVFCDQNMNVKAIVELDDWSHQRTDRIQRDEFVDAALTEAGYDIIHITDFDEYGYKALNSIINPSSKIPTTDEELAAQIKIDRSKPTYEEWRAAKMKELQEKEKEQQ